jgi:hypothetical protein
LSRPTGLRALDNVIIIGRNNPFAIKVNLTNIGVKSAFGAKLEIVSERKLSPPKHCVEVPRDEEQVNMVLYYPFF